MADCRAPSMAPGSVAAAKRPLHLADYCTRGVALFLHSPRSRFTAGARCLQVRALCAQWITGEFVTRSGVLIFAALVELVRKLSGFPRPRNVTRARRFCCRVGQRHVG